MSSKQPRLEPNFGVGAIFETFDEAKQCQDELRESEIENISCFLMARLPYRGASKNHPEAKFHLLAVGESGEGVTEVVQFFLKYECEPWEPPTDVVLQAVKRRKRSLLDNPEAGTDVTIEKFPDGATINEDGTVEAYKPDLDTPPPISRELPEGVLENAVEDVKEVVAGEDALGDICGAATEAALMRAKHEETVDHTKIGVLVVVISDENADDPEAGIGAHTDHPGGALAMALAAAQALAKEDGVDLEMRINKKGIG